jgi:methylglutaconyl-CoA hydratase
MKTYNTLEIFDNGPLVILKLNRPEKRNALNPEMIQELQDVFNFLTNKSEAVLLNLVAKGQSFCAGADIDWLKSLKDKDAATIKTEFSELGKMLKMLYDLPQITLAMVHGSAYGGGIGLFSACDFVISAPNTNYSFSEIHLGMIPATISPYVVNRIGKSKAKKLFLTGEKFDENYADAIGLVDEVANPKLDALNYQTLTELLLTQPRHALKEMKKLFRSIESGHISPENYIYSSDIIAGLIKNEETQVLFNKFLSKSS